MVRILFGYCIRPPRIAHYFQMLAHRLPDELPLKKGMVRVQAINSVWRFTPLADGQTEIYFQQHSDPGGSIPALLVNRLVKDIPFNTLKNFRQFIKDSEK